MKCMTMEEWKELIGHLQTEEMFGTLGEEADMSGIEDCLIKDFPTMTLAERNNVTRILVAENVRDRQIRAEIENKYGRDYSAVIEKLGRHVLQCTGCRKEYLKALDELAGDIEGTFSATRTFGVNANYSYLDDGIGKYDILGIVNPKK